jgi:signal transduction histidine kinase
MVPLHLLAFLVLYLATLQLLESEVTAAASRSADEQLAMVTRDLDTLAMAHSGAPGRGHRFQPLVATYDTANLQLFLPDGSAIESRADAPSPSREQVMGFLESGDAQRTWVADEDERLRLRGLARVDARRECGACHQVGTTLGLVSMSNDLTEMMSRVHTRSRRNLAILLVAWAALLTLTTRLVKRSVQRSTSRFERRLVAAASGDTPPPDDDPELSLDPRSARLDRLLQEFLERQRQRDKEVASRLAHTDQLASVGQLAAGLAHEIRNPLAGIQGALEILRDDSTDEKNRRLHEEMLAELGRVNETLQTLLSSARPSAPRLASVDLSELMIEVHRLLEPSLRRKGVALEAELPSEPLEADIDKPKIRQVLINLVQNAAEAMEGDGRIVLRAGGFAKVGEIVLAVEDDGPGIPAEEQEKIFEPFYTTKFSGTGLGLAIARSLVEQHSGSLLLESEPGHGTTFFVLLPAAAPETVATESRELG